MQQTIPLIALFASGISPHIFRVVAEYRFGGGSAGTVLHPIVAVGLLVAVILIIRGSRRQILVPILLALFLIPTGQVVVVAGVHLNVYRIILLIGLARAVFSTASSKLATQWNSLDRLFTLYACSNLIVFSLQWLEVQAIIKGLGDFLDTLGGYYLLRQLIQDRDDVRRTVKVFGLVAIIMGICMIYEQRSGANIFGPLGGILIAPEVRSGKIRSQGAFQHSILAGSFGATLLPLLIWLWSDAKYKRVAIAGAAGAIVMTYTCHSSTTLGSACAGIVALCMWPLRKQMRWIRYGLAVTVIGLHLVMKGPVWSLLEHIDMTGSSESYHRYQLIDTFIRHFGDWWLVGTGDNSSWGWKMMDTSNQYVTCGIVGGLSGLVLFIAIISKGFGMIGTARGAVQRDRRQEWFLWCLGAAMFAHVVVYFGIGYFDQMQFAWYALLAMISAAGGGIGRKPMRFKKKAVVCEAVLPAVSLDLVHTG
jgi:hypothetical protein